MWLLAVLDSQGIVVKCIGVILFRTVEWRQLTRGKIVATESLLVERGARFYKLIVVVFILLYLLLGMRTIECLFFFSELEQLTVKDNDAAGKASVQSE